MIGQARINLHKPILAELACREKEFRLVCMSGIITMIIEREHDNIQIAITKLLYIPYIV